jgi:hypothetical protein
MRPWKTHGTWLKYSLQLYFSEKRENMIFFLNIFLGFKGQQFYEEPSKIPSTFIF